MDRARRRKFGQNFLDDATAKLIAGDLAVDFTTPILEIGPGHGAMTVHLLEYNVPLTAVEIDEQCVALLKEKFKSKKNFNVIHSDFLKFDLDTWISENNKPWITGNLPYNVSTGIISSVMPKLYMTKGFMGMVQFEVAKRICAIPGSRDYGSLSVYVSCFANTKILRKIGPEHFTPKPNVDSATILLTPLEKPLSADSDFFTFVQRAFLQKRKRISNSLSAFYKKEEVFDALEKIGFTENARAEELSPENFLALYQILGNP